MDLNTSYIKKTNGCNTKIFRIKCDFTIDCINIVILHESNAFLAKVTANELCDFATIFEMDVDDYTRNLKLYLSENLEEISVDINNNLFIIYKHTKIKYFYTKIDKIDYNSKIEELLDNCCESNLNLEKQIFDLNKQNNNSSNDLSVLKSKMKEYVDENNLREGKLYSCFINILNEKKKRIQYLSEILETKKDILPENNKKRSLETLLNKGIYKKTKLNTEALKTKLTELSDSEESSIEAGYNTDEEINPSMQDPGPSTSTPFDLFREDSPPPTILPPRLKRNDLINKTVVISNLEALSNDSKVDSQPIIESKSCNIQEYSPTVDFSTQNLLDRM